MLVLYIIIYLSLLWVLQYGVLRCTLGVGSCLVLASDPSSFIFALTLSSISISVLTWSFYYIDAECEFRRFSCLLLVFLCSMLGLVFSADLLSLFVAWDLLGFTSFFLVLYYRSRSALAGGILTGVTNRVGDVCLLALFGLVYYSSVSIITWSLYLLFVISFTKSAQVPFSSWLPAAILAPTPVSALVHSSTLVTAGVYLLYRYCPATSPLLIYVGIFTTLIAGLAASLECDTKKIIALSTLSQLGLMVTSLGLGSRSLCFAHLNTHAAFKALLFVAIGAYIHSIYGSQEARSVIGLHSNSPLTLIIFVSASISMCGLVFLSGWVTKEAILEFGINNSINFFSLTLFYLGIGLTLVYRIRLSFSLLISSRHMNILTPSFSCSFIVKAPMFWLVLLSVVQGSLFSLDCELLHSVLSIDDKLVVWGVLLFAFFLSLQLSNRAITFRNPYSQLVYATALVSSWSLPLSMVRSTEVSAIQGGGFGCLPSLLTPFRTGIYLCSKLSLFLSLVLLLL